jgi:hypothetical protein
VETVIDWHSAWAATVKATIFIFPHRKDELDQYTWYIIEKFTVRKVEEHLRIIMFDEAVRGTVGGGCGRSLLDQKILERFSQAILLPGGIMYDAGKQGKGK